MVGLFAYNPPLILQAVRDANKLGTIQIVAFDEDPASGHHRWRDLRNRGSEPLHVRLRVGTSLGWTDSR